MANPYTTEALIEGMKLDASLPTGGSWNTTQFLRVLTDQQNTTVSAFLKGIREEFLVTSVDIPVTSSTVSAPARAMGGAFRTIQWMAGTDESTLRQLDRIEPERVPDYTNSGTSEPAGYVFVGNTIQLVPAVTTGTLRLAYQQRLGRLVLPDACGEITAINTGTGQVTVSTMPDTFEAGATYDLVSSTPNFVALAIDQTATVNSPTTMTFSTLPADLAVGDFVCLATESCIPQLPIEVHSLLAQAAAAKIAQATGSERAGFIAKGLDDMKKDLTVLLSPRSDGSPRPIVSRNGAGRRGWRF